MKRLLFSDEAIVSIILGKKLITIRKYREGSHDVTPGQVLRAEFPCKLVVLVLITDTTSKIPFKMLSQMALDQDGYANHDEALADLRDFYPNLTMDSDVVAISFKPLAHFTPFEDQPLIDVRDVIPL